MEEAHAESAVSLLWEDITDTGPGSGVQTSSSSGSIWDSIIRGAAQVGSAAVTGQNPFYPTPTKKASSSFLSGPTPWLIGGALVLILATRKRSA